MSDIKDYVKDFLDEAGYKLGYDTRNLPEVAHIELVWRFAVPVWEYNGLTEEEYYKEYNSDKKGE